MPSRELPVRPDLEHLKKQARNLLRGVHASEPEASGRFAAFSVGSTPKLADALHVIAREYGFATWPVLRLHVEMGSAEPFRALGAAVRAGDAVAVREVLARHASLRARINEPLPNYSFDEQAIVLLAYNATVTRYEEDQLFLNDNNTHEHQLQDNIQKSVTRTRPFVRVFGGASALLGAAIIGMYTYNAWLRLQ